jgi:hypothetical protein
MQLYHGSKSGIQGTIRPMSREQCDFGCGFYMGTDKRQTLTLICSHEDAKLYTVDFDMSGLKVMSFDNDEDWALSIAYYRGTLEAIKGTQIYKKYAEMGNGCDVIYGLIANDQLFATLRMFLDNIITDVVLYKSISALNLGTQYVAKTEKACSQVKIITQETLFDERRAKLITQSEQMRHEGVRLANDVRGNYRREGRFLDEILEAGI